jgi:dTDP-4-amino-4,6-dideoxygalactose transaminase
MLRSLRNHGEGRDKYDAARIGINGRLDTIQAAVLLQKLTIFPDEIDARNRIARRYDAALADVATVPTVRADCVSVFAQYTIRVRERDRLAAALKAEGIPTAIHYAKALHQQRAYDAFPVPPDGLPVTEQATREVLSLPMHPYLEPAIQDRIIGCIRAAL